MNLNGSDGSTALNARGQGTVIVSEREGNNTFTIDASGDNNSNSDLIVIQHLSAEDTLKFTDVVDQDSLIERIMSVSIDSPYAGANAQFMLSNGTQVIIENFTPPTPFNATPTSTDLLKAIAEYATIVTTTS